MSKFGVREKNFVRFLLTESWAWWGVFFVALCAMYPSRILELIGLFYLADLLRRGVLFFWLHALRPGRKNLIKYGRWAVVTGASDGIGAAIAIELAKQGLSVVLIARTKAKLEAVAEKCKEANGAIETKVICADFSLHDRSCYEMIRGEISQLEVGILINNVGIANEVPQRLHEYSDDFLRQVIEINTVSTPLMTRMVLPQMLERQRGAIMNVGSASAAHPTPMLAVYSATKAYLDQLTASIHYEYKSQGIDIICCAPYYVMSNLSGIKRETYLVCSSERFARDAVAHLGQGEYRSNPYIYHAIFEWMARSYSQTAERLLVMMEKSRNRNQHKVDGPKPDAAAAAAAAEEKSEQE